MNWFKSFFAFLFPTIPATFRSRSTLPVAVLQLRAASLSSELQSTFREGAVGSVTEQRVQLTRSNPFSINRYKPRFIGTFLQDNEGVVLAGQFAMSTPIKIYALFGICFCMLMSGLLLVGTVLGKADVRWASLIPLGLLASSILEIKLSQRSARKDVAWLSRTIEQALDSPP